MPTEKDLQLQEARYIASFFDLPRPFECSHFDRKGNINQKTYLVTAGSSQYLLQQLNPEVFRQPRSVMASMISCIETQRRALSAGALQSSGIEWETLSLVPTRNGHEYLEIDREAGQACWRMMARIDDSSSYRSLQEIPDETRRLRTAEEAGKGLAVFRTLTSRMDPTRIESPLPGYRDTALYYAQLESILAENRSLAQAGHLLPHDTAVRESVGPHFLVHLSPEAYRARRNAPGIRRLIDLALEHRSFGLTLVEAMRSGALEKVVIHGDTKLDNFLFSASTGRVKALVDLDTVMPHTWLSDWGDMARSLVNVAGEREEDLDNIRLDMEIFEALVRGFLGLATVNENEIELMADAAPIMALELGVRFLTDYLRGDSYFRIAPGEPADLNGIRAKVQFRVFELLRSNSSLARRCVSSAFRRSQPR